MQRINVFDFKRMCSYRRASQVVLVVKNLPANAGDARDADLIPGSGRPKRAQQPFQYSCLEHPKDRGSWWGFDEKFDRETTSFIYCWWYNYSARIWLLLKKTNIQLPCDPAITLLGIYPREMKVNIHINICICDFTSIRMASIKEKEKKRYKSCWECGDIKTLVHC